MICFLLSFLRDYEATARDIQCEIVENHTWEDSYGGVMKTCFIQTLTIDSTGFSISTPADATVRALNLGSNENLHFLPEKTAEKFNNLELYFAYDCRIESIAKINFIGLEKLLQLHLDFNQIEVIADNVFEDLKLLEVLELGKLSDY